jgi:hypothetical protein
VLHLNGYDGDPVQQRNLILSEDDYLAHFVRLARDQQEVLPMNVLRMLAEHSFLFLGYSLDDWEFRVLLQGLIRPIAQMGTRRVHVGVQLEFDGLSNADQAIDYLRRYWQNFHIDIYWGTPGQFVGELYAAWQESLKEEW